MKRINYIVATFFMVLAMTSCTDALDLAPLDNLSDKTFWKTPADLEIYVNTLYQNIPGAVDNANADGWDNQVPNNRNTALWGEGIVPVSGGGWESKDWANIRACNYFMTRYTDVPGDNSRYVAEVCFFRAMFYFDKVKMFGEVPFLNTDLKTTDTDLLYTDRGTRSTVVDSILADLDYAIDKLPTKTNAVKGRLHKDVASALASRVSLYEGTWRRYRGDKSGDVYITKCVTYSEQVMNSGYAIWKGANDPYQNYYKLFVQEDMSTNPEIILPKVYDRELNLKHGTTRTLDGTTTGISKDFVLSYLCKDGLPISSSPLYLGDDSLRQEMANRDPRMQQAIDNPDQVYTSADNGSNSIYNPLPLRKTTTGYQLVKFHSPFLYDFDAINSTIDYPSFRYAEILLNYAEAKAELGTITDTDLERSVNLIRERVSMPKMTLKNVDFSDPNFYNCGYPVSNIIREIRRERRIELLAEGFRADDIKRWNAGKLLENPKVFLGMKVNLEMRKRYDEASGAAGGYTRETTPAPEYLLISYTNATPLKWLDKLYLSPLPKDQLKLNPKLTQNPGW